MDANCELSTRETISAFYCREHLLICATGELPNPGYEVKIERSPLAVEPPRFSLIRCRRPGSFPQVITPFKHSQTFQIGTRRPVIMVDHQGGTDEVNVQDCGDDYATYMNTLPEPQPEPNCIMVRGASSELSFDDAFADALAKLPPSPVADGLTRVEVVQIGGLFGGIVGFHELFVKVKATIDGLTS